MLPQALFVFLSLPPSVLLSTPYGVGPIQLQKGRMMEEISLICFEVVLNYRDLFWWIV